MSEMSQPRAAYLFYKDNNNTFGMCFLMKLSVHIGMLQNMKMNFAKISARYPTSEMVHSVRIRMRFRAPDYRNWLSRIEFEKKSFSVLTIF